MKIIKKVAGYHPEVVDLSREEVSGIFNSGMDKQPFFNSLFIVSRYLKQEKTEKTFNTSILFPHMNITHYHNDIYVIKKRIRFMSLNDAEIEDVMKLFKYDTEKAKDPKEANKPIVKEEKPVEASPVESPSIPTKEDIDNIEEVKEDVTLENVDVNTENN